MTYDFFDFITILNDDVILSSGLQRPFEFWEDWRVESLREVVNSLCKSCEYHPPFSIDCLRCPQNIGALYLYLQKELELRHQGSGEGVIETTDEEDNRGD